MFIYNVVTNNVALKKHLCFLISQKIWITFLIFSQDNFIQHKPHIYLKKKTYVHPKQHNSRFVTAKFVSQWITSKVMKKTRQYRWKQTVFSVYTLHTHVTDWRKIYLRVGIETMKVFFPFFFPNKYWNEYLLEHKYSLYLCRSTIFLYFFFHLWNFLL